MKYFKSSNEAVDFFKNFLEEFFADVDDDKEAIDDILRYTSDVTDKVAVKYKQMLNEAFDFIFKEKLDNGTLMNLMENSSNRIAYDDRDAERFFVMIYKNVILGKDEIYDYYEPTEEELEEERREQEELDKIENERLLALSKWASDKNIEQLFDELNSLDVESRQKAAEVLASNDDIRVDIKLIERFNVEVDNFVKYIILKGLTMRKSDDAYEIFINTVTTHNADNYLRDIAFYGLIALNDKRAIMPLIELLHKDKKSSFSIARVLGSIGKEGIKAAFESLYLTGVDKTFFNLVIDSSKKDVEVANALLDYFDKVDLQIKINIIVILSTLKNEDNNAVVSSFFKSYVKSDDKKLRLIILRNLHHFCCPETIEVFKEALNDVDEDIRSSAERGLAYCSKLK